MTERPKQCNVDTAKDLGDRYAKLIVGIEQVKNEMLKMSIDLELMNAEREVLSAAIEAISEDC